MFFYGDAKSKIFHHMNGEESTLKIKFTMTIPQQCECQGDGSEGRSEISDSSQM
jgi:hypothetical protein